MSDPTITPRRRPRTIGLALCIAGVAAVVGGSIWVWKEVLEDRLIPKRFGVVEDGLIYRSGQLSRALVEETLDEHGIKVIVSLRPDEPGDADHEAERRAADDLGIDWKLFPLIGDGTGDIANYAAAIKAIAQARAQHKAVLVHCGAGTYRTGGVLAAYRMFVDGVPPAQAWEEMTHYDWDPDNPKLPAYLNEHMAELAELLVEKGVIAKAPDPLPVFGP